MRIRVSNQQTNQGQQKIKMESICDRAIRCLCSCLINKETVSYTQVNDQHSKFMTVNDHIEEDHRQKIAKKSYQQQATPAALSGKLSNYLQQTALSTSQPTYEQRNLNEQAYKKHSLEGQSLLKQPEDYTKDYSDVINADHPYFNLFKDKLVKLTSVFQLPPEATISQPDTLYPLKLYCYQQNKNNVFVYFFKFPTDIDTYESISNDFQLQKKFDGNIDEFKKQLQIPGGNAKLIYLSYKKVLILSARDFSYIKYSFKKYNEHWSICASDMSRQEIKDKVRGQMILTMTRIVEVEGQIQISVYSNIDMKINLKMDLAKNRGFAEIRKYLDKVYTHIKNNQSKIL